ncbi:MAG: RNA polymerase subunit sigma-70 [Acidobacteria bacterium]|nr:MAG: RNA polymerase subunit sigma-70 [Acidobacteriota bacterium]
MSESEVADAELMRSIAERNGDSDATRELYKRYGRAVYSWVRKITMDPGKSEDLTQEVFVRAWRKANTYDPTRGSVGAWLYGIARNCAHDLLRKKSDVVGLPDGPETIDGTVEPADIEAIWIGGQVASALEVLSPEQRTVLELAYFEHLTQKEIAERLDMPLGTVKSRTFKALKRMKDVLASRGIVPEAVERG